MIQLDFVISSLDLHDLGLSRGWPGNPMVVHWKIPDPMEFIGREKGRINQFRSVYASLYSRIKIFVSLPLEKRVALATGQPFPERAEPTLARKAM